MALTLVALTGCLTSASAGSSDGATTSAASNTADTLYAEVAVPANPKRVVAFALPEATALLDLGITLEKPTYVPSLPSYDAALKGVPDVRGPSGDPDLEKVAAL